jgi:hypothetical protein
VLATAAEGVAEGVADMSQMPEKVGINVPVEQSAFAQLDHRLVCVALQAEGVAVTWHQTTDEVVIKVPVDQSVRGKEVDFEVHPTRLRLAVREAVLLEGSLADAGAVAVDSELLWVQGRRRRCTLARRGVS